MQVAASRFDGCPDSRYRVVNGRGRSRVPRAVAIAVSRIVGGHSHQTIAEAFGLGHYASIPVGVRRLKERMGKDRALSQALDSIKKQLGTQEIIFDKTRPQRSKV
ncbi:hypothetical protein DESUT3_40730 [Desulfuromonas versatilis]|uniref:Chromosomal replication initiator DnaA C-terminal domain-containing protein n=1 Tax=Desulfuromonas versatilis TaxID=2802975 RepID=A0ABM8I202_9BACT|nr:hypothetical protein DESUT3_40730 [Desulfuromonas versatilis]